MKKNTLIIGITAAFTLFLGSMTAFAGQAAGHLDSVNQNSVCGWAWDHSDPDAAVTVEVVITNQQTGEAVKHISVTASEPRKDLAESGKGSGNYGFLAPVDWASLADGVYLVTASGNGQKLPNSLLYHNGDNIAGQDGSINLKPMGVFLTTAYCPCRSCSEGWGRHTSSGALATAGHTIAVDPRVIPYGSKIMINGVIYTAEDCGGAVKGNHIDIYFNTHAETRQYGSRNVEVYLVQ